MSKRSSSSHLAKQHQQAVVSQQVTTASMFSGPLPPPEALEHYNQITPGLAERIVAMAERESAHRHEIEKASAQQNALAVAKTFTERRIGQSLAFTIAIVGILAAVYCASIGAQTVGSVVGGAALVGIVSAFLYIRKK